MHIVYLAEPENVMTWAYNAFQKNQIESRLIMKLAKN